MKISVTDYETVINGELTKKFSFVSEINAVNIRQFGHLFYLSHVVLLKEGSYSKMSNECKQKHKIGGKISFWEVAICFNRKFNIVELEKDLERIFSEMFNISKIDIRNLEVKYILN